MLDLTAEQARLEERMASLGVEKFRAQALEAKQEGEASRSKSVSFVLNTAITPLAGAIAAFQADAMSGRAGRKHSADAVESPQDVEALLDAFVTKKRSEIQLQLDAATSEVARLSKLSSAFDTISASIHALAA